jgi:hypothetical protein
LEEVEDEFFAVKWNSPVDWFRDRVANPSGDNGSLGIFSCRRDPGSRPGNSERTGNAGYS